MISIMEKKKYRYGKLSGTEQGILNKSYSGILLYWLFSYLSKKTIKKFTL